MFKEVRKALECPLAKRGKDARQKLAGQEKIDRRMKKHVRRPSRWQRKLAEDAKPGEITYLDEAE